MDEERQNYYNSAELFSTVVPSALSDLLKKLMEGKPVEGYKHNASWWKSNKACLSRAPPAGMEVVILGSKDPSEWSMNFLLKVIKYCNHNILERYGPVWEALNVLIKVRKEVLEHKEDKKVPTTRMEGFFSSVFDNGIGKFDLPNAGDVYAALSSLKTKSDEGSSGEKYHKELLDQEKGWAEFEGKLYERGAKPKLEQLKKFMSKSGPIDVIQQVAPHYTTIGIFLLGDETGATVSSIHMTKMGNVVMTTQAIFEQWLGKQAGPSWNRLHDCLRNAQLNALAKQIDQCLI